MALINRSIPNLYQGVSQQAASMRLPTQCEGQENAFSSIVEGLKKRPPTVHLAKLTSSTASDAFVHVINRDAAERYIMVMTNGDLEVYDFSGNKKTVNFPNGKDYLSNTIPREGFSAVTAADYTFIVNKNVTTAIDPTSLAGKPLAAKTITSIAKVAPVAISSITYTGFTATVTTATAHNLYTNSIVTISGAEDNVFNGTFSITKKSATTFSYTITYDEAGPPATPVAGTKTYTTNTVLATTSSAHGLSVGNKVLMKGCTQAEYNVIEDILSIPTTTTFTYNASSVPSVSPATGSPVYTVISTAYFKGSKQRMTDLPTASSSTPPVVDDVWEVSGDSNNNFDNYYVKWDGKVWRETLKPGVKTGFDASTMPHQLIRNSDGTFTFQQATWNDRLVGDDTSNKPPSFVGRKVNEVFFHRNRFGMCSDENIIFSQAGDFFNFWAETVTNVLDSDPIDVAVNHTKVSIIRYAVPFNTSLMLFSDQVQFQLSARDLLTPKTVNINATTEFEMNPKCKPVGSGQDLYFAVEKGGWTGIREYYVQPLTYTNDASEITSHVPKYIPPGAFRIIPSNSEDILFVLNTTHRNEVYVYKYYWGSDNQKVQSAWSVWKFDSSDVILNGDAINNYLYLVIQRSDGIYLEMLNFQAGFVNEDMGILVHLDRKCLLTGSYDAGTGLTTWTLPFQEANLQGVLGGGYGSAKGTLLTLSRPSSSTVTAVGDYSTASVYFGRPYTMRYTLSEIFFKDNNDKSSITHYQLMLKNLDVLYSKTGYIRIEVTPKKRDTYTYSYTGKEVGVTTLGTIGTESGKLRAPVFSTTKDLKIEFINDTYLPCFLQSAEWEAVLSTLSRRI